MCFSWCLCVAIPRFLQEEYRFGNAVCVLYLRFAELRLCFQWCRVYYLRFCRKNMKVVCVSAGGLCVYT